MVPVVIYTVVITSLVLTIVFGSLFNSAVALRVQKTITAQKAAEIALLEKEEDEAVYDMMASIWAMNQVEKKKEAGAYGDVEDLDVFINEAVLEKMADDMEFYEALYKSEKTEEDAKSELAFYEIIQHVADDSDE